MPKFMLNAYSAMEMPEEVELTPEFIQAIIEKYNNWTAKLRDSGHLLDVNKLTDGAGRVLRGHGATQTVTDGPYAEAKEVIGGYWLVEASGYDEAVELTRDCPHLEFGGTMEVRQVEDIPM